MNNIDVEVKNFISKRFAQQNSWCDGNCYWFAVILTNRFNNLQIYYMPIRGHFIAGDGVGNFYDWNGKLNIQDNEEPILLLQDIKDSDILWYNRLMRDCKL